MSHIFSLLPVFDWVVWTSAKVSVFIIFLLLVKYLFRNKLGAIVNYLLWSVVIVGLLLPWTPPSSFSIYNLVGLSTQNSTAVTISPNLDQNFGKNIIEARTNYISYLESGPLYNWLKNGEWKTEFSQNPALTPLYQTNENGQTYGSAFASSIIGNPQPDLISAGKDGTSGYVKYEDLMGPRPKTPEEAIAMQEMGKFEKREIPLYAADGKTVIGSF